MRTELLRSGILLALSLGTSAATAQTELFFATGVDSTGWAQAQSNTDGHVLIESPQYPRGLWLHLVDEAGDALAGIRVEYQSRPDSLVAIRCVDPAGKVRETLVWTRSEGTPLRLMLEPKEAADLPAGLDSIDWQIDPSVESLLEPVAGTRLIGWEAVIAFLRDRWQGQAGRVAVQLDASTLAIELDLPEAVETLVAHLRRTQKPAAASIGEIDPLEMQVFAGNLGLREGVILLYASLFDDSNLEEAVRQALARPQGRLTLEEVASLTELRVSRKNIRSLVGIEHFAALQSLYLDDNGIVDITPLTPLTNLTLLSLYNNRIADLTPLNQLNNLQGLVLDGNQIDDIAPLSQLNNLQGLVLDGNQIDDITPLSQLNNLQWLALSRNEIDDITPLSQLDKLQYLDLDSNRIEDLTPLIANTGLGEGDEVDLTYNPLSDQALNEHIPTLQARGVEVIH